MSDIKLFVAMRAFVIYEGKILLLRESSVYKDGTNAGKYDVVGGRVEPGQRFDESLRREIKEETGLVVNIRRPFYVGEWRPVVRGEKWQIVGTFFECFANTNAVTLSKDHDKYVWINPIDYNKYNLIDSIPSAIKAYINFR